MSTSLINKLYGDVDTIIKMTMLGLRHVFEHINTTSQHELPPFFNRNFYSCLCRAQKLDYLALDSIVELASFYMILSKLITKITYFIHVVLFCI